MLSIIAVTFDQGPALSVFLHSLACQTSNNYQLILLHDGPASEDTDRRVADFHLDFTEYQDTFEEWLLRKHHIDLKVALISPGALARLKEEYTRDARTENYPLGGITFVATETRANRWGHNLREIGLNLAEGSQVNFQNADNYCVPKMVEILEQFEEYDFVYWPQVHSYAGTCLDLGEYATIDTQIAENHIDMAAFSISTSKAKAVGFPFRSFAADWEFVEAAFKRFPEMKYLKLKATLGVHN